MRIWQNLKPCTTKGGREDFSNIRKRYKRFSANVLRMVECLEHMSPGTYVTLRSYYKKFDFYSTFLLAPPRLENGPPFVCSLQEGAGLVDLVGGKALQLAELELELNLPVPQGFVVTANSFNYYLDYNDFRRAIDTILCSIELVDPHSLTTASEKLIDLIMHGDIPSEISDGITTAWNDFFQRFAKRSSRRCSQQWCE